MSLSGHQGQLEVREKATLSTNFAFVSYSTVKVLMDLIRDFEHSPGASVSTDDEIEQYIRETAETGFHPSGTCRMGPGSNSVVNDELKIHGLNGIRVADASIFPTIPSGNTNAACIMVGEKVSELIKESINRGE